MKWHTYWYRYAYNILYHYSVLVTFLKLIRPYELHRSNIGSYSCVIVRNIFRYSRNFRLRIKFSSHTVSHSIRENFYSLKSYLHIRHRCYAWGYFGNSTIILNYLNIYYHFNERKFHELFDLFFLVGKIRLVRNWRTVTWITKVEFNFILIIHGTFFTKINDQNSEFSLFTQWKPITPNAAESISPTIDGYELPVGKNAWKRGDCQWVT